MALQKFSTEAVTKTHGAIEANILDAVLPQTEMVGATANTMRSVGYAVLGWVARGKKETGRFSLY